jgi:hypothetical protein
MIPEAVGDVRGLAIDWGACTPRAAAMPPQAQRGGRQRRDFSAERAGTGLAKIRAAMMWIPLIIGAPAPARSRP